MSSERVCREDALAIGEVQRVEVGEVPIALVRLESGYRAIHDVCSHQDFRLSTGEVWEEDCAIECMRHGAQFSLDTGEALTLPATESVKVYPVQIVDGEVEVDVS